VIVLGLLVLLAVGGLAVSGTTARGGVHPPRGPGLPGYHLPGPGSGLFFFGLVLAAAAVSALVSMVASGGAARRYLLRQPAGTGPEPAADAADTSGQLAGSGTEDLAT
jgi:hypothetical protein